MDNWMLMMDAAQKLRLIDAERKLLDFMERRTLKEQFLRLPELFGLERPKFLPAQNASPQCTSARVHGDRRVEAPEFFPDSSVFNDNHDLKRNLEIPSYTNEASTQITSMFSVQDLDSSRRENRQFSSTGSANTRSFEIGEH
eukprot:GHVS01000398.1.p1 GENE.GHVS01000398.1~~GHVS01000398.1.p1  ORF type:complete len:142 (-),score=19.34 GHVS01000398.1:112-537(-)